MIGKKRAIIIAMLVSVIIIAAVTIAAWFYAANKLSNLDAYRESINNTVREELNRNVSYKTGTAALTLRDGLSFRFTNVVVKEIDGIDDFVNVHDAFVRVRLLPLLINRVVLSEIVLDQPRVSIIRDSAGELNIADLMIEKKDAKKPRIRKISIKNGLVTFLDQAVGHQEIPILLEKFNGNIYSLFSTNRYRFQIKTSVVENRNKAQLTADGFFRPAPAGQPFYESRLRASVHLIHSDLRHYSAYLKKYTPLEQMAGHLDADVKFSGRFSDFKCGGTINVKNALLEYKGVFRDVLEPRRIQLDYDLVRDKKRIRVDVHHLAIDQFETKGNFGMEDLDTDDPLLKASATTGVFLLRNVRSYIPWGIIPESVGNFIDVHIKDGNFRLVEGTLEGRLSRIANFNDKESVDVLSIQAEVDKGVFEAHPTAPLFHDINGILELKKRQFSLKKINARFGLSPLTMEGGISDFGLHYPIIYTALMKIQPVCNEVIWLLGKEKFRKLNFKGPSSLVLSGKGTDEDYHINAQWNLTNAAYAYPDVLEKPALKKNRLAADIIITKDAVNLSSFDYDLSPVNVKGSMLVRFNGQTPVSFHIGSTLLDARSAAEFLPSLRKVHPVGTCSLALSGKGDLSDPGAMQWKGNIGLNKVALKISDDLNPLTGLTGNVLFKGSAAESSTFKAQLGTSNIQTKFKLNDFRKPEFVCAFDTKALSAADLGLQGVKGDVFLRDIKGVIAFKDKMLHVENLSFNTGESGFYLTGQISDFDLPKIVLNVNSPYLNSDDLKRLLSLKKPKNGKEKSSSAEVSAQLVSEAGRLGDIDFKKLRAGVKYSQGKIDFETLEADCFDGKFKAKGNIGINTGTQNTYEAAMTIKGMSLEELQSYLEIGDRSITGRLSLAGNISARGGDWEELKKTAEGTFQIRADKGALRKFPVMSKIFSLLNVYQLLKFQLPDMARDGMPYHTITADIAIKQGILSSDNFFIKSDAMEFSGNGKINFIKKELDFITGVHPMQTIDVIASRIPIAGWILTDEKGKLITVHFKVGGSWEDPEVSPMPVKSIGKGTLDIFRRIFQLPEKLITDTGDVLFGR